MLERQKLDKGFPEGKDGPFSVSYQEVKVQGSNYSGLVTIYISFKSYKVTYNTCK